MKKTVFIFGGGISGLTVAHELINKNYIVHLFEKDTIIGGMAKTRREQDSIPSEHSWRGFGPHYKNLFNVMKQIPIDTGKVSGKTVYNNLSEAIHFKLLSDKVNVRKGINFCDFVYLFFMFFS